MEEQKKDINRKVTIGDKEIKKRKKKKSKTNVLNNKIIKRKLSKKNTKNSSSKIGVNSIKSYSKQKFKSNIDNILNHSKTIKNSIILNDYELNSLSYKKALKYDKRTYFQYYISLLKIKHPIIFSFCCIDDYNSILIKISIFVLYNTAFFDESTIHKIYEDEGIYNFVDFIPQILFSFIISHTSFILIKYIFLSERNILKIKNEKAVKRIDDKLSEVRKNIVIKYICFYVGGTLFLIFFWYYISSFGAVYQNTQVYLIKNTLISFGFALLYPFFINLLPGIFRLISLKNGNECLYKIDKLIQII